MSSCTNDANPNQKQKARSSENVIFTNFKNELKFGIEKDALDRIEKLINTEKKATNEEIFIRIIIDSGGCAGNKYYIIMDDYSSDFDLKIKHNEQIVLVIDDYSLGLLNEGWVFFDESDDDFGESELKVYSANLSTCSCGSSFKV